MKLLILLLCVSLSAFAEVYQWQDAQGKVHFSDQAYPNATLVPIATGYSYYTVEKVFDGDTLLLSDGRKIRLLGINTPEVQHFNQAADAGGVEAKQWLTQKLLHQSVRLVTDSETFDKYERTLAHVYTQSNEHINASLVAQGWAALSIYPPNLLFSSELESAQNYAEQHHLGIWNLAAYAPMSMAQLETLAENEQAVRHHWLRLQGRLQHLRYTAKSVYLEFLPHVSARIERRWLSLFPDLESFVGKNLELRGWVNQRQGAYSMLLRHPSAIKILPQSE
jgi:micrococcal nuclease